MLTRVLVLLLLKVTATVLPANAPNKDAGMDPDLTAFLWLSALRTRLVNSAEVRSAMDSRWRGANGDVGGDAGDEYVLRCSFSRELRKYWGRNGGMITDCLRALKSLMANIENLKL